MPDIEEAGAACTVLWFIAAGVGAVYIATQIMGQAALWVLGLL